MWVMGCSGGPSGFLGAQQTHRVSCCSVEQPEEVSKPRSWEKYLKVVFIFFGRRIFILFGLYILRGFPGGSDGKESACSEGDLGLIPGSGRSPGEGNSNPLQYSCLENPMDRGAWWGTVHAVAKSQT